MNQNKKMYSLQSLPGLLILFYLQFTSVKL